MPRLRERVDLNCHVHLPQSALPQIVTFFQMRQFIYFFQALFTSSTKEFTPYVEGINPEKCKFASKMPGIESSDELCQMCWGELC